MEVMVPLKVKSASLNPEPEVFTGVESKDTVVPESNELVKKFEIGEKTLPFIAISN